MERLIRLTAGCVLVIGSSSIANAQAIRPGTMSGSPRLASTAWLESQQEDGRRACEGCPTRSVGKAIGQTTLINVVYGLANLARGQVTARVTPKTWWANMEQGWVWDLDDFLVNQVGHPYQGNNYFTSGRANGLSFYESAAVTAFGSGTWEYFGETNHPSLNDFINTTLGGIALGEMFHRTAWLVRDTRRSGRSRLWREIAATAIDPVTGLNRFVTGDASRISERPAQFVPPSLAASGSIGALWRGSNTRAFDAPADFFFETDIVYGNPTQGRSREPFDAFAVRLTFGGGNALSEARVRGRLLGQPFPNARLQLSVLQSYSFLANDAFHFGAQSFETSVSFTTAPSPRTTLFLSGWGGVTVLGAVDSLPLGVEEPPPPPDSESAGQGVSEGPRFYDYGPGSTFGGSAIFSRDGRVIASALYEARTLFSLDGVRANHLLQRARVDLAVPLGGRLGLGATGEFFDRRSYYQDADRTKQQFHYPQFRLFLTWSLS